MEVIEFGFDWTWRSLYPRCGIIKGAGFREGKYITYLAAFLGFYIYVGRELDNA
jgi:hypothetical protein